MKRLLLIIMIICFIPSYLVADEVDDGLPSDTPAQVKESARQVIRLGVQNQGVTTMTQTMLENRYTERQMLAAHEVLMNAKRQNLTEEPIMNKFHESVAKSAQPTQTLQAMETVRSRYEKASGLAETMTQGREQARLMTKDIAECLNAGMGDGDMKRVSDMLRQRTKDMKNEEAQAFNKGTLSTVMTMARAGADSGNVIEVVGNAFQRGFSAKDMEKLGNTFMNQAKGASSASGLAKNYANAIRNGATADNIGGYGEGGSGGGFGQGGAGSGSGSMGGMGGSGKGSGGGRGRK